MIVLGTLRIGCNNRRRPAGRRGCSPSTSRPHRSEVGAEGLGTGAGLSDALVYEHRDEIREARSNRGDRDGEHHTEGVSIEHHNRGEHRRLHMIVIRPFSSGVKPNYDVFYGWIFLPPGWWIF